MMKNNLIGLFISALLHAGLLIMVASASNKPIKPKILNNNVVLNISMFQAEVITPAPIKTVVVKEKKEVEVTSPVVKKLAPIKIAKITPAPKIKIEPTPAPIIEKKPIIKVTPKAIKVVKIKPTAKPIKKYIKPKKVVKKKVLFKKAKNTKRIFKKTLKRLPIIKKAAKRRPTKVAVNAQYVRPKGVRKVKKIATKPRKSIIQRKPIARHVYQRQKQQVKSRAKPRPRYKKPATKQYVRTIAPRRPKNAARATIKPSQNTALSRQYKARLQQLIAKNKRYPKRAKRRGVQGRVTLSFKVRHSGIISDIKIIKGTRNNDLNTAAINAIRQTSGKLAYSKGMNKKSLILTITLSYIIS